MPVYKSRAEIPTIDCTLITIEIDGEEFGFDTANQLQVEAQIEEEDAVRLIVKKKLRAQKLPSRTITGHQLTLTDNVFNPELVVALQGGEIVYDTVDTKKVVGYNPPAAGSDDTTVPFTLHAYSSQYNAAGQIVRYEKISYPNCKGQPVAFSSEDDAFRAPEYVIDSAPDNGERPYTLTYVDALPVLTDRT